MARLISLVVMHRMMFVYTYLYLFYAKFKFKMRVEAERASYLKGNCFQPNHVSFPRINVFKEISRVISPTLRAIKVCTPT